MQRLVKCITFFVLIISKSNVLLGQDTSYYYSVCHYGFDKDDFKKGAFKTRQSSRLDESKFFVTDSVSIEIVFIDSLGGMTFRKYFNGELYLEGQYTASDNHEEIEGEVRDIETNALISKKRSIVFYPRKSGKWRIYRKGDVVDVIEFNP